MDQAKNPYELFQKESPEIFEAYDHFVRTLAGAPALDAKTKQLLYIAMKIVAGDSSAVKFHLPMAKKAGASKEEIRETILLTLPVTGLKGIEWLAPIAELFD